MVLHMDCLIGLKNFPDHSFDAIVTDPPYELGFMGKKWDSTNITYRVDLWVECLRVLKPGGYLLSFSSARTYHRMTCAIEDAGFEIRDQIMWVYGSGFPKSLNISKAIDKIAGAKRPILKKRDDRLEDQTVLGLGMRGDIVSSDPITEYAMIWEGWGTALKPAHEPICVARKSLGNLTTVANVLKYGTGAINIDNCRIDSDHDLTKTIIAGRWPANLIHDGSDEVIAAFPKTKDQSRTVGASARKNGAVYGQYSKQLSYSRPRDFCDSAARFFYCTKASTKDRDEGLDIFESFSASELTGRKIESVGLNSPRAGFQGERKRKNIHPTVKPTILMRYLIRLITPPGGVILDPFAGSGSTGKAAVLENFNFIGFELNAEYVSIANARIDRAKHFYK